MHNFNPSTREAEAGKCLCVGGQPGLHRSFQASEGYTVKPLVLVNKARKQNAYKVQNEVDVIKPTGIRAFIYFFLHISCVYKCRAVCVLGGGMEITLMQCLP